MVTENSAHILVSTVQVEKKNTLGMWVLTCLEIITEFRVTT